MRKQNSAMNEVSPGLTSRVSHALGLDPTVPRNDKVYSVRDWEEVIEVLGSASNCPRQVMEQAKARYTYYMLYHYAPSL